MTLRVRLAKNAVYLPALAALLLIACSSGAPPQAHDPDSQSPEESGPTLGGWVGQASSHPRYAPHQGADSDSSSSLPITYEVQVDTQDPGQTSSHLGHAPDACDRDGRVRHLRWMQLRCESGGGLSNWFGRINMVQSRRILTDHEVMHRAGRDHGPGVPL